MSVRILTTVVTPATDRKLVTLLIAKDDLEIPAADTTKDAFLTRAIEEISAQMSEYCGRVFPVETVRDTIFLAGAASSLSLSRWPVTSIASVVETDGAGASTTLAANVDYMVDEATAMLTRLDATSLCPVRWTARKIVAQYAAGYATIPSNLKGYALRLITSRFRARGRDPLVKGTDQPGLGSQTFWIGAVPGETGPFPNDICDGLDLYRMPQA